MTRNEEADDDEYAERWSRRSDSLDSAHACALLLTPDQRLLEASTEWYEQHGRYVAIAFSPDDWEDDVYSKRGRSRTRESRHQKSSHGNLSPETESDPLSYALDAEALPNLSRSFTTCGSIRSSSSMDPAVSDKDFWAGYDKGAPGKGKSTEGMGANVRGHIACNE